MRALSLAVEKRDRVEPDMEEGQVGCGGGTSMRWLTRGSFHFPSLSLLDSCPLSSRPIPLSRKHAKRDVHSRMSATVEAAAKADRTYKSASRRACLQPPCRVLLPFVF
jgi:hypothetical protein